jgi:anaerobic selenocysteine-containing dehydrogenase
MLTPGIGKWEEALQKAPFYVHVAPFISEMALSADILLPSTTYLEEWAYDFSPPGAGFAELRLKQPVVSPRGKTRPIPDVIFDMAKLTGGSVADSFTALGDNAEGFVKMHTAGLLPWKDFVESGVWRGGNGYEYRKYERLFVTPSRKFDFNSGNLKALFTARKMTPSEGELSFLPHYRAEKFVGEAGAFPLVLMPYQPLMVMENGSQNYPWAQEAFLPMCGVGWQVFAEMNADAARKLGLKNGGFVWVESASGKIKAKVKFSEGIHPEVVAVATGQGHHSYGKWQTGIGVNPNEIIGSDYDSLSGQSVFFNTRVKVYKA